VARWFAVWTGVAPDKAIAALRIRIAEIAGSLEQTSFAMTFITHLLGSHRGNDTTARQAFKTPKHLKLLYILMHQYIRSSEDINRVETGVYSPELRDEAQAARDSLT
jgi:hypothetical protein